MRVRISYSVDLEDVPLECARMLHDSLKLVEEVKEAVSYTHLTLPTIALV